MIKFQHVATGETDRLAHCERVIERGFTVFVEVGQALAEIRDAKLYRASHKTFEDYCKARWDIGRSRAYELIDQANVTAALADAGVNLSAAADISKRDVRTLKEDLPAAAQEIKARVEHGEKVEEARKAVVAARQAENAAQKEEFTRQREEARAALPDPIKARETAKQEAIAARESENTGSGDLSDADRIAELEETVRWQEAEIERLKAENRKFGEMKAEWERGGFEAVIAGKDAVINAQASRIERESQEKVRNLNASEMWRKRAEEAGWSNDVVIPLPGRAAHG